MSLAETQELLDVMRELVSLLQTVETKTEKLVADTPRRSSAISTYKQLERVAARYLILTNRLGLPDDAEKTIQILSRIIVTSRMAYASLQLLAGGIATTPGGIAIAIASGAAGFALAGMSMLEGY